MQFEFRTALLEVLKSNSHRQRLIVILLDRPNLACLDAELLQLLKTCTCLAWGEQHFWQKLRFAMPELVQVARQQQAPQSAQHYLRYQTLSQQQQQQPGKSSGSHKFRSGGASLLKSAGLSFGLHQHQLPAPQHQQLVTASRHQFGARPLPQPLGAASASQASLYQPHAAEEHHYAHLTPATMNQQQPAAAAYAQNQQPLPRGRNFQQPIYGDAHQDNPVHI